MINISPKKRIPELKLTKIEVADAFPKKPFSAGRSPVTTFIDGIPIVEYICNQELGRKEFSGKTDRSSVISVDSCDSLSNSPRGEKLRGFEGHIVCPEEYSLPSFDFSDNSFSPEPVGFSRFDIAPSLFQTDAMIARKKPTRWDCETPAYRIDSGKQFEISSMTEIDIQPPRIVTPRAKFELQPRDPRVKTFKKHHTLQPEPDPNPPPLPTEVYPQSSSVTYGENLMDISSPEYNPPSPFGSPTPTPSPPPLPSLLPAPKKRTRGFFDSDSETSELDFSMGSSYFDILNRSIDTVVPETQEKAYPGTERKAYFWDSSSADEEVNPTRETLENIKLNSSKDESKPKRRKREAKKCRSYSSDDLDAKYNVAFEERKPARSKSASNLRESRDKHKSKSSRRSPVSVRRDRTPKKNENERRRPQHVCIYCGDRGHYSNDACPLRVCSMCFKIGHNFRECKLWGKGRTPKCSRCQISCHEKSTCGEIWRQCHNTTSRPTDYPESSKKTSYTLTKEIQTFRVDQMKCSVYCCNCAKYGHTFFQCDKARPSRYFFIPLVGHHDIPMSAGFQELRRNVDTKRCMPQLLPKSFQVVKQQRFWGDGNQSSSSDEHSAAENGSQGDKNKFKKFSGSPAKGKKAGKWEESKGARHPSDTGHSEEKGHSESPDRTLDLQQLEYQKAALNAYHLAFARAHRGESLYAREILNSRGFITVGAYPVSLLSESNKVPVEERRQLTPVVYLPDRNNPSQLKPEDSEHTPPAVPPPAARTEESSQVCESHASFARPVKTPPKFFPGPKVPKFRRADKQGFKGKPSVRARERREREKRKFDKKRPDILDARECINRNRTKRHQERQVRLSERDRSKSPTHRSDREKRGSATSKKDSLPPASKRSLAKKERTGQGEGDRGGREVILERTGSGEARTQLSQDSDTFLCIDEAN